MAERSGGATPLERRWTYESNFIEGHCRWHNGHPKNQAANCQRLCRSYSINNLPFFLSMASFSMCSPVHAMYTLIGLSDGIYLEASKARLHWGISCEQAWRVGNPRRLRPDDDTRILWDESIFGGLSCSLLAYLPGNAILDKITIWLNPPAGGVKGDEMLRAAYDFVTVFDRLVQYFGPPQIITPGPSLTWKHDGCEIGLGISDRFEERMYLTISRDIRGDGPSQDVMALPITK